MKPHEPLSFSLIIISDLFVPQSLASITFSRRPPLVKSPEAEVDKIQATQSSEIAFCYNRTLHHTI